MEKFRTRSQGELAEISRHVASALEVDVTDGIGTRIVEVNVGFLRPHQLDVIENPTLGFTILAVAVGNAMVDPYVICRLLHVRIDANRRVLIGDRRRENAHRAPRKQIKTGDVDLRARAAQCSGNGQHVTLERNRCVIIPARQQSKLLARLNVILASLGRRSRRLPVRSRMERTRISALRRLHLDISGRVVGLGFRIPSRPTREGEGKNGNGNELVNRMDHVSNSFLQFCKGNDTISPRLESRETCVLVGPRGYCTTTIIPGARTVNTTSVPPCPFATVLSS